jgi:hypothetical protein
MQMRLLDGLVDRFREAKIIGGENNRVHLRGT